MTGAVRQVDEMDAATAAAFRETALSAPPGGGVTPRWNALIRLARHDLPAARLVEAHVDAISILGELDGDSVKPDQYWAVWAAEPPDGRVAATMDGAGEWRLTGTKRWCSGAHLCTHALISAHAADGRRLLAVDLAHPGVTAWHGGWVGPGMRRADTESVELDDVPARAVGGPSAYLERPGFWHSAIGVAACWYGGAAGVLAPLRAAGARLDPHGLAHLGAADSALHGARCVLRAAAAEIAQQPIEEIRAAKVRALRTRSIVENAATQTMERVGRALGPGPLAGDAEHAQRVADLTVYIRQSHAERDHAALAEILDVDAEAL